MTCLPRAVLVISATALGVLAADAGPGISKEPSATGPAATSPGAKVIRRTPPATPPADPRELLRVTWDAVLVVLGNDKLDQKAKEAEVEKVVCPIIDFPLMAKLALGKTHWTAMTAAQRDAFTRLFVERLKSSYRERIARYKGQKVVFKDAPAGPDKTAKPAPPAKRPPAGTMEIAVDLIWPEGRAEILHKLRKADNQWMMYDTEIEGVSILLTYRSQFNDILRGGGIEDLLSRLARPQPR